MECCQSFYIFASGGDNSCLDAMHRLHIFYPKGGILGLQRHILQHPEKENPQTHSLWINSPVEIKIRQNATFSAFWDQLYTACPHQRQASMCPKGRCIWVHSVLKGCFFRLDAPVWEEPLSDTHLCACETCFSPINMIP